MLKYLPVLFLALLFTGSRSAHAQTSNQTITYSGCTATLSLFGSGLIAISTVSVQCTTTPTSLNLQIEACIENECNYGSNENNETFAEVSATGDGDQAQATLTWSVNGSPAPQGHLTLQ
jgi:hypothetical protein